MKTQRKNEAPHFATKKLKQYREDRGWTQEYMANYIVLKTGIKIDRVTLAYLENGTRGMNAQTALEIATALDIPIMDFVYRKTVE